MHVYRIFLPYSPSNPLSLYPPPPTYPHHPDKTYFTLLVSIFVKKWHFCLFKTVIQGVALWHFHVYQYYFPNWFRK
jgi:hypothetical protein